MNRKKKLIWFCLPLSLVILSFSCQNSNSYTQKSTSKADIVDTEKDTRFWLREARGIRDILEDEQGNLWFSSPDYVAKFDGIDMYYFSESDGLSITGNILEDHKGLIWIEDGFRAFKYDGEYFSEEKIDSITSSNGLWMQRGLNPADTTFIEPGIYEVSQNTTKFHPLPVLKDNFNQFLHLPSTKAIIGKDSTVWFATMNEVYGFKNNRFISIGREEMGRLTDERQIGIRGIFVDSKGILWMADNGAGVFNYNGEETINFTKKHHLDEGDVEGSTLHRAFSIAEDSNGRMWFGTVYSGIWSYNPETKKFRNYTSDDGVESENIWTICRTKEDGLLFAGESPAAVYRFNGKTFDRKY